MNGSSKKYWTDDPEMVERYVLGRLSEEEKRRLDAEIAECEPCREMLRRETLLAAGVRRFGRDGLRSRLRRRLVRERRSPVRMYQSVGLAAAVVIIAVGVGVYQMFFADLTRPTQFGKKEIVITQGGEIGEAREEKREVRTPEEKMDAPPPEAKPAVRSGAERNVRPAEAAKRTAPEPIQEFAPAAKSDAAAARSIWLLGTVVMETGAARTGAAALSAESRTADAAAPQASPDRPVTLRRGDVRNDVALRQRPLSALPTARRSQMGSARRVETLVETTGDGGLQLTIYTDDVAASELDAASVETLDGDSLVVTTATQRILYRLPPDLFTAPSVRTKR
ncbi:MAG: zf-HC2 domain-containing protein [Bacteroidetes bacterium]|nr:MAG: zf-HC2 domain-containing protein [Bacteroidota bacterium]